MDNKITIKDLETKLWEAADTLRGNLSAEDYMHVVLGILTIKFINDKNESVIKQLISEGWKEENIDYTDLRARNAFVVPPKSKWSYILTKVGTSEIGTALDDAISELGKVDLGGGGTIAYILANYNVEVIDCGVGVLSMHAPWEVTSKADIYEAYRGYIAFLRNA